LELQGRDTNAMIAKDIMIKDVITVDCQISIQKANEMMVEYKIGCLPILERGDLVGILTKKDLNKLLQDG
jgi:CBS domain-containing protein